MTGVETILDDDPKRKPLTSKGYIPDYAPGEIIVQFRADVDHGEEFTTAFGKALGYEQIDCKTVCGGIPYRVQVGKEKEAIRDLQRYTKFVETAYRYDRKVERRVRAIDQVVSELQDLNDHDISDRAWRREIDRIVGDLLKLR